jgi:hypothetical protein
MFQCHVPFAALASIYIIRYRIFVFACNGLICPVDSALILKLRPAWRFVIIATTILMQYKSDRDRFRHCRSATGTGTVTVIIDHTRCIRQYSVSTGTGTFVG